MRILLTFLAAGLTAASGQSPSFTFRYGAEQIFIPSEMPPVVQKWDPANKLNEPGIKKGPPFEAALVRVFNEDTPWTSEIAVFRFRDGTARAQCVFDQAYMANEFLANNSEETKAAFAEALQGLQVIHEPHESKFKPRVPHAIRTYPHRLHYSIRQYGSRFCLGRCAT